MNLQKSGILTIFLFFLLFILICQAGADTISDLTISDLTSSPSAQIGGPLYATVTVTNLGTQISMTDMVTFVLSPDTEISEDDYNIGTVDVKFIRPGKSETDTTMLTLPENIPAGTYYIGAILTGKFSLKHDENTDNNIICGNALEVSATATRSDEWYRETISNLILVYSNEERSLRNLSEFIRDPELDIIAQEHSDDMATRNFFNHTNPDGEDPADRAERHGYDQLRTLDDGQQFYGIGENIVKIPVGENIRKFGDIDADNPQRIAEIAVQSFMDSPPHKKALLLKEHKKIGIGVAFDGENYYATQNFF